MKARFEIYFRNRREVVAASTIISIHAGASTPGLATAFPSFPAADAFLYRFTALRERARSRRLKRPSENRRQRTSEWRRKGAGGGRHRQSRRVSTALSSFRGRQNGYISPVTMREHVLMSHHSPCSIPCSYFCKENRYLSMSRKQCVE